MKKLLLLPVVLLLTGFTVNQVVDFWDTINAYGDAHFYSSVFFDDETYFEGAQNIDGQVLFEQDLNTTLTVNNPNITVASNLSDGAGFMRITANGYVAPGNLVTVNFDDQYPGLIFVEFSPRNAFTAKSNLYTAQAGPASFTVAWPGGMGAGDELEFSYTVAGRN